MKLWLDARVSFRLAPWLEAELGVQVEAVRDLGPSRLPHRDPADRLLAATARTYGLSLVTADRRLLDCASLETISART